jgi:hypothetical protein
MSISTREHADCCDGIDVLTAFLPLETMMISDSVIKQCSIFDRAPSPKRRFCNTLLPLVVLEAVMSLLKSFFYSLVNKSHGFRDSMNSHFKNGIKPEL